MQTVPPVNSEATLPSARNALSAPRGGWHKEVFVLMSVVAVSMVGIRIAGGPYGFTTNDASRWATIRALVESGNYSIGHREVNLDGTYRDVGIISQGDWGTIDIVMDPETRRFYSSKPTPLPTVLAAEYWVLRNALNLSFGQDRLLVPIIILITINLLPFALYLRVLGGLVERFSTTDWGRLLVFTAAAFGTFVSGYSGTLNNHTVAATSVLFAVYQSVRIHLDRDRRWWRFALAGLFLGWAFCNELPTAALALGTVLWLARLSLRDALLWTLPAMLLPVAGYALTQYLAVGAVMPTYALKEWYDFAGNYWSAPVGIDRADEPKLIYAAQLLVGHTGILSLTPVLLLGWIGMIRTATRPHGSAPEHSVARILAALTVALTALTFVFYVLRTATYGGITAGPRWFIWLVPLWLLTMVPEADRWALDTRLRRLALVLLGLSAATASYALRDPWQPSLLLFLFRHLGIVSY